MTFNLSAPNPGEKISANLLREIVRAIRSLSPIAGTGMKLTHGPNGTVYSAAPAARAKGESEDNSCFRLGTLKDSQTGETHPAILNNYYRIGHLFFPKLGDATIDNLVDADNPLLAIAATVDDAETEVEFDTFPSWDDMIEAAKDTTKAIIPLYLFKFKEDGDRELEGVKVDFRNMAGFFVTEG